MANLVVTGHQLTFGGKTYRCAIGKGGFSSAKKEGDGATPLGTFKLRECWYRADRISAPQTKLLLKIIHENDGWCDDPKSTDYNKHIILPPPLAGEGGVGVSCHKHDLSRGRTPSPNPSRKREGEPQYMPQGVGHTAFTTRNSKAIGNAKALRKNQTDAEKKLWKALRQKQLENYKFRRQQPIGNYIVDFVCMDKKLVIELDGGQHNEDAGRPYDEKRTRYLETGGYRVLRFWNNDVLQNLEGVGEMILRELEPSLFQHAPVWEDTLLLTSSRKREEGYSASTLAEGKFSFEHLWREDHVYDLIVPIGYNDDPVEPGKGSAIFLHLAHDEYKSTEGCIALAKPDFLAILPHIDSRTVIEIKE